MGRNRKKAGEPLRQLLQNGKAPSGKPDGTNLVDDDPMGLYSPPDLSLPPPDREVTALTLRMPLALAERARNYATGVGIPLNALLLVALDGHLRAIGR